MSSRVPDEEFFEKLASSEDAPAGRASSRLKSKIYSALLRRQVQSGPLGSLSHTDEEFFEKLASSEDAPARRAPSRLKSKIYSALLRRQAQSGPLRSLSHTKADGHGLCVFENMACLAPTNERTKSLNLCSVCHARLLAESLENAPIYWGHCPYVRFQNR